MSRHDRELITKLADQFGMANVSNTKYSESKYDASTGTLYCEGISIPKATVTRALEFFERQKDYYRIQAQRDSSCMDQYLINTVAHNAILMLVNSIGKTKEE